MCARPMLPHLKDPYTIGVMIQICLWNENQNCDLYTKNQYWNNLILHLELILMPESSLDLNQFNVKELIQLAEITLLELILSN